MIVLVLLFRLFGGKIPFIDRPKKDEKAKKEEHDFGQIETTSKCAACGTYVTEEDALRNARLAKILTADDYDTEQSRPILWTPSDASN